MIPYGRQSISSSDIAAVIGVLESDFLTQGPVVPRFEGAVAEKVGAEHAVAANSATSALHMAVAALGLGQDDWLWTQPITFVASANCGLYCGAKVDFVDIDPETFTLCPNALKKKLDRTPVNQRPKAVLPVHMAGQSANMEQIAALAKTYGFKIVEDASHAIGGSLQGKSVGSCVFSDITVFSFHPVKVITSGEGGMALTNDPVLADKMAMIRSHGITKQTTRLSEKEAPVWYYEQQTLGWNYRMTDIQAALGLSQLDRLDAFVERRNVLALRYHELLSGQAWDLPFVRSDTVSSFHLYIVRLPFADAALHRRVFEGFREAGVGVQLHYMPVHLQPLYQSLGFQLGDFPISENYANRAITLPLFPELTERQQDHVASVARKVSEEAQRAYGRLY